MNYEAWQNKARQELISAGIERNEAYLIARKLLDFHTGIERAALLHGDTVIADATPLDALLKEATKRRPLPHILGNAPFWDLSLEVTSATLVPRPETEFLVEAVINRLKHRSTPSICDLGTGTGAIAITLSKIRPDATVFALELSPEACEVAQRNVEKTGAKVEILEGAEDWFSPLKNLRAESRKFDALVSNPPYIASLDIETLEPEVRIHEPRLALDGGPDGLAPYRVFAERGREFLKVDGFFAMELGAGQWNDIRQIFEAQGWQVEPPIADLQGIDRVLIAK